MKKYLYNLCICMFSMTFVFQADEAFGMSNSKRTKQQSTSQKKIYNFSQKSKKNSRRNSNNKSMYEDFADEEEDEFEDEEGDEFEEERRSKKRKPTLSELEDCQCVQAYIKLTKDEDDEGEPTKKKLKNRDGKNSEEEDNEDEEVERSRKSRSSKNSNRPQYSSKKNDDESWKHIRADAGYFLEKYKGMSLFNKQYNIPSINLVENSTSIEVDLDKNINGNNEDKSVKENNDLSTNHKYKYRIDQKEAVKFRQDLEKYRQTYA